MEMLRKKQIRVLARLMMVVSLLIPAYASAEKVATPVVSPGAGTYDGAAEMTPSCATDGAAIFYTTDGSTPTAESTQYTPMVRGSLTFYAPISLNTSATLKMIAVKDGMDDSDVAAYDYTITAASPATVYGSGEYKTLPGNITLTSATSDAAIYYTLDGSEPTTSSTRYTAPIDLSGMTGPVTLKAYAVKDSAPDSPVKTFQYTVNPELVVLTDDVSIPAVISEMTSAEKAALLTGVGSNIGAAGATYALPRLHITGMELTDGPAGVRLTGRYATAWPNPLMLASTWNTDILNEIGTAVGHEVKYYGADIMLGPGMNMHRDPLAGRVFEYYSEDPYLTGVMAGAWANGVQGVGVGATLKHYAVNQFENNRRTLNVTVDERTLREIYLSAFGIAVKESAPWSVMAAYNLVNGIHCTENTYLLNEILRETFGFNGLVMSDWGAYHNAQASYNNGFDLNTPGGNLYGGLLGGPDITASDIENGVIHAENVNTALTNILNVVLKTDTFKNQMYDKAAFAAKTDLSSELKEIGKELSKKAALEGMVLLKNEDNTLPLSGGITVGTAGKNAVNDEYIKPEAWWASPQKGLFFEGGGSAAVNVNPDDVVTLNEGLRNGGLAVYQTAHMVEGLNAADAADAAANSDVGVVVIGKPGQENTDNTSIDLTAEEIDLIQKFSGAYHEAGKKLVVLLNVAYPVACGAWEEYADAILYVGLPGTYGANAIADILAGKANPSGKLVDTWPKTYANAPTSGNVPGPTQTEITYSEGLNVGYRYYDKHADDVMYPFGYGLSYTTFEYSNLQLNTLTFDPGSDDKHLTVSVDVANTGSVAGKEVAELYVSEASPVVERPVKELKAFAKTELLQPGDKQTLTFTIGSRDLAYFDESTHSWVVNPGTFRVIIGGTSDSAVLETRGVSAEFTVAGQ